MTAVVALRSEKVTIITVALEKHAICYKASFISASTGQQGCHVDATCGVSWIRSQMQ